MSISTTTTSPTDPSATKANTIRTTFLVLSGTNNLFLSSYSPPENTKIDVLLHCGNLSEAGGSFIYRDALEHLAKIPAELKLVIAGSRDLELDRDYEDPDPDEHDNDGEKDYAAAKMYGPEAEAAGVTYLTEGTHSFTLSNGASFTLYASSYTPGNGDWAFEYPRTKDRFNLPRQTLPGMASVATFSSLIPSNVDIVMTHGPPHGILDATSDHASNEKYEHVGCPALWQAIARTRPLLHCCGHVHEGYGVLRTIWEKSGGQGSQVPVSSGSLVGDAVKGYGVEKGKSTVFVNASIICRERVNEVANAPWILEVGLPRKLFITRRTQLQLCLARMDWWRFCTLRRYERSFSCTLDYDVV